jgi:putative sigma-54 modulation protein
MISKLEISAKGDLELTDDIRKYVEAKIAKLDRFMNKHARKSAHAEVHLNQEKGQKSDRFTAEVVLHVPGETMTAKESTLNIFAAIDIVEAKLRNQLRRYKDKHVSSIRQGDRKGMVARIRRLAERDFWGSQN